MTLEQSILLKIRNFEPVGGNWLELENLLEQLWSAGVAKESLPVLFGIFERFPEGYGEGVLWSILHGVESLDFDYEEELRESIGRVPSHMGSIMLKRLETSKQP